MREKPDYSHNYSHHPIFLGNNAAVLQQYLNKKCPDRMNLFILSGLLFLARFLSAFCGLQYAMEDIGHMIHGFLAGVGVDAQENRGIRVN